MSDFTAKDIEQALIDIDNLTSDRGERIGFKPTHMLINDPAMYEVAAEVEKAARKEAFGDGINALSRSDVVMMLNDAGLEGAGVTVLHESKRHYEELFNGIRCDFSLCAIEQAILKIGPAFVYDFYVPKHHYFSAREMLREMPEELKSSPFAMQINVNVEETFSGDEWCIEANGKSVGSEGA